MSQQRDRSQIALFVVAMAAGLAVSSCQDSTSGPDPHDPVALSVRAVTEAEYLSATVHGTFVIRDTTQWEDFWTLQSGQSVPPVPTIDFDNKMIIALCWGSGYSGCQDVVSAITAVCMIYDSEGNPDAITVQVDPLPPLGDCDMIVYPIQILELDASPLPVRFTGQPPVPKSALAGAR